jgi:nucleotide-binding universal stress UspA family protein
MSPIKKILTPVDFSEGSVRAARGAMAWAERFESELCLLHVVPDTIHDRAYREIAEYSLRALVEDWTRGTRDALDALAAPFVEVSGPSTGGGPARSTGGGDHGVRR